MDRNIGAPNRRIPPDVHPTSSASRDLDREEAYEPHPDEQSEDPGASIADEE